MTLEEVISEIEHSVRLGVPTWTPSEAIINALLMLKDYKQLKEDYIEMDKQFRAANTENGELKRMLRAWNNSAPSWIPCSERMPEKDGDYLCISNNEYKILPYRNGEFYCVCFDSVLRCCNSSVTRWMPLTPTP